MSEKIDRRKFLKAAIPIAAAPAILSNRNLLASSRPDSKLMNPPLEVLYDTLGNAVDGWGWAGQGSYTSTFQNALGLNYIIVTCYLGTLPSSKRLRGFECAVNGVNFGNKICVSIDRFLGRFYLGIWRTDGGAFYQAPLGGSISLLHGSLSDPNVGSISIPVGNISDCNVYVIGWDNLDVLIPANVPIQMAFYVEETDTGDTFGVSGSSRPGPNMLRASSDSGNGVVGQPMACRITVSDPIVTAANADISGRVIDKSGRGIARARVSLQNTQTGESFTANTNPFGYFRFTNQPSGNLYIISATAKGRIFQPASRTFELLENISDLVFVGGSI